MINRQDHHFHTFYLKPRSLPNLPLPLQLKLGFLAK
jgi:hypothetical protein